MNHNRATQNDDHRNYVILDFVENREDHFFGDFWSFNLYFFVEIVLEILGARQGHQKSYQSHEYEEHAERKIDQTVCFGTGADA